MTETLIILTSVFGLIIGVATDGSVGWAYWANFGFSGLVAGVLLIQGKASLEKNAERMAVAFKEATDATARQLRDNAAAIDRGVKATMLLLVAIPEVNESIRNQARQLAEESDNAIKQRDAK